MDIYYLKQLYLLCVPHFIDLASILQIKVTGTLSLHILFCAFKRNTLFYFYFLFWEFPYVYWDGLIVTCAGA